LIALLLFVAWFKLPLGDPLPTLLPLPLRLGRLLFEVIPFFLREVDAP